MVGYHEPVLLREVLEALEVETGEWYLDATLGDGGHSLEILKRGGKVVGIDVDPQAIERAGNRFETEEIDGNKWKLIVGNFRDLNNLIPQTEPGLKFKGILFDLGVSSWQLGSPQRGFSFMSEGPLDMRMDPTLGVRALDLINGLNKGELYELFTKLGEENHARALAEVVVSTRQVSDIKSTKDLAKLVEKVVRGKIGRIHPATKVFQALRIAVNDELNAIKEALPQALDCLKKDGTLIIISFHSLEDRIVKDAFKAWQTKGLGWVLTKKPILPLEDEVRKNPRSRSAKLRIFEKDDHYTKF